MELWYNKNSVPTFDNKTSKSILHPFTFGKYRGHTLNVYQGCQHRCGYCYATYEWSPEFYDKIYAKSNAPELLENEIRKFMTAISTLGLLASCLETDAIGTKKDDTSVSTQNIRPFIDHDGLARRYESRAGKLLEIAADREKQFQYYEDKSHLYGRHGQD